MKNHKQKYHLGITRKDETIFERWITEEQKTVIENYIGHSATFRYNPYVDEIIETVCEYFNEPIHMLDKRTRAVEIVRCRYLCFYFFVKKLNYGISRSAKIFNQNHATVIYGLKKVAVKYQNDVIEIDRILRQK